jgi:hypothetical protein
MAYLLKRRRIALVTLVAWFHILSSASSQASAETWTWFRSVTTEAEWWTTRGQGDVDFSGGVFSATLRDGNDKSLRLSLRGSVSEGLVHARATVADTDAPTLRVSGRLKRFCWRTGGGREVLILTDRAQVIGLFRELAPSQSCKPTT